MLQFLAFEYIIYIDYSLQGVKKKVEIQRFLTKNVNFSPPYYMGIEQNKQGLRRTRKLRQCTN